MATLSLLLLGLFPLSVGYSVRKVSTHLFGRELGLGPITYGTGVLFVFWAFYRFLGVDPSVLRGLGILLSAASFLFLIQRKNLPHLLLGAGTVALFTWVGAYYELPSDPLTHLERVLRDGFSKNPVVFFYHLVVTTFPNSDPLRFDLWQGIAALLFSFTVLRTTYLLTQNWIKAGLCLLATYCFFGNTVFSFLRYYTFASTFLAFLIYLEAIPFLFRWSQAPSLRTLLFFSLPLFLAGFSHAQEGLFLLVAIGTTLALVGLQRKPKLTHFLLGTIFLSGFVVLKWLGGPLWPTHPDSIRSLTTTLGVPGLMGILASMFLLLRKSSKIEEKFLAASCLSFTILALLPPFHGVLVAVFGSPYIIYRLFYGSLYWLPLALLPLKGVLLPLTILLFILLGIKHGRPIYGRLDHLFVRPSPWQNSQSYLGAIRFLEKEASNHLNTSQCKILTDINGQMALMLFTPWFYSGTRFHISPLSAPYETDDGFERELGKTRSCYVLLRKPHFEEPSWVGRDSGHWNPEIALPHFQTHPYFKRYVERKKQIFKLVYEDIFTEVYQVSLEKLEY